MIEGDDLELFERSVRHATGAGPGRALDVALDALGWREALDVDPHAAVSVLFELQGATNVSSSAIDHVLRLELGLGHVAVVLPPLGCSAPPGAIAGHRLTVHGLGTAGLAEHETAFVVAAMDGNEVGVAVPVAALDVRAIQGIDPTLGLVEVSADNLALPAPAAVASEWGAAVAAAQVAIGHELIGASRQMLELAREHALGRVQFGRPISEFQAIRHRLADTLVAIEMANAVVGAAWLDRSPTTAAMAKALAGRAGRTAARHSQQVLAGIGFTTEHPLHLFVRRVLVLDQLFGSARTLTAELGNDLSTGLELPPLLPL